MSVSYSVDGIPQAQKMLERFTDRQMHNRLRRTVRAGAKPMQAALKNAAASEPTGNLPDTFRKIPAAKVSASRRRGGDIVASLRPKSPLFNIFEPGAGSHEIAGDVLANADGSFFARGAVRHPGMRARPILPTAFAAGKPAAQMEIARVLFEEGD